MEKLFKQWYFYVITALVLCVIILLGFLTQITSENDNEIFEKAEQSAAAYENEINSVSDEELVELSEERLGNLYLSFVEDYFEENNCNAKVTSNKESKELVVIAEDNGLENFGSVIGGAIKKWGNGGYSTYTVLVKVDSEDSIIYSSYNIKDENNISVIDQGIYTK